MALVRQVALVLQLSWVGVVSMVCYCASEAVLVALGLLVALTGWYQGPDSCWWETKVWGHMRVWEAAMFRWDSL